MMKFQKKNILAVIMACLTLFNFMILPVNANVVEEEVTVLVEEIEVNSAEELERMAQTENRKFDEVPLYFQTDYPDTPFSQGTVATSGCGITCLAMVATYLLEKEYFPDELAVAYNDCGEHNLARLEYGIKDLELPIVKKVYSLGQVIKELEDNKVAIVLVNDLSVFTNSQHFIVFTGINSSGKITVNDPYGPNYEKWKLKNEFENGFKVETIAEGFSGAWIFEKGGTPIKEEEEVPLIPDINFPTVR